MLHEADFTCFLDDITVFREKRHGLSQIPKWTREILIAIQHPRIQELILQKAGARDNMQVLHPILYTNDVEKQSSSLTLSLLVINPFSPYLENIVKTKIHGLTSKCPLYAPNIFPRFYCFKKVKCKLKVSFYAVIYQDNHIKH